ncbi:hypothetical protein HDV00_011188 [Rhizophlyctis rosea]|nr:hypothetical protein HDV00_011188 [Rhizophlyctis rosea]
MTRQASSHHRMSLATPSFPRSPSGTRERQSISTTIAAASSFQRNQSSATFNDRRISNSSRTQSTTGPLDRRRSSAFGRGGLIRRPSETGRRPSESGRKSSILHKTISNTFTAPTDQPDPTASRHQSRKPTSHRLRRTARMVGHAVHLIKFLSRVCKNPIDWDWHYDPPTSLTGPSPTTSDQNGHATLTNSHDLFGVRKLFESKHFAGYLDPDMRMLFRKEEVERTKADLDRMLMWCGKMDGLAKYHPELQRRLLKQARYERHQPNRLILREGQKAMNFYIILDGEVEETKIDRAQVIIAREKSLALAAYSQGKKSISHGGEHEEDEEKVPKQGINRAKVGFRLSEVSVVEHNEGNDAAMPGATDNTHDETLETDLSKGSSITEPSTKPVPKSRVRMVAEGSVEGLDRSRYMGDSPRMSTEQSALAEDIRALDEELTKAYTSRLQRRGAGETFGDSAILTHTDRQSSFTTTRTSEFLVIDADEFLAVVSGFVDDDTAHKMEVIRSLEVFKTLGSEDEIARTCGMQKFKSEKAVVVEGGRSESLYFIRSGSCRVVKLVPFIKTYAGANHYILEPISKWLEKQHHEDGEPTTASTHSLWSARSHSQPTFTQTNRSRPTTAPHIKSQPQTPTLPHLSPHSSNPTIHVTTTDTFLTAVPESPFSPLQPPPLPRPLSAPIHPSLPRNTQLIAKLLTIDTLGPGDHFGEGTIPPHGPGALSHTWRPTSSNTIGTGPSPVTIITSTPLECLVLSKIDLHRLASGASGEATLSSAGPRPSPSFSISRSLSVTRASTATDADPSRISTWQVLRQSSRITWLQEKFGPDLSGEVDLDAAPQCIRGEDPIIKEYLIRRQWKRFKQAVLEEIVQNVRLGKAIRKGEVGGVGRWSF